MKSDAMTSGERRAVFSLAGLYSMRMLGLFMVLPVLALYADALAGSTPLLIGIAIGGYGLTQALLQIPFGFLSDRLGRKQVIVAGLLLFIVGSVVAATADSIHGVIIGRCLQGSGAIASSIMALLADLTREESRTKAMAVVGMTIGLSFSAALVLGPLLASGFGLSGIFWATAALASVGLALVMWVVPTPRRYGHHLDASVAQGQFRRVLSHPELLRLDLGILLLHLILTACFVALPLALTEAGWASQQHWWLYLPMLLLSFLAMVPFIIMAERKRRMKQVFTGAILLLAASLLGLAWGYRSTLTILLAMFLFFMAFNLLEATLPSLISKLAPAAAKGTAMGVYSSSQFLGAFFGGILGGWLYGEYGVAGVFIACAALGALWWLVALGMRPPRHLTSHILNLKAQALDNPLGLSRQLLALPGVEDVVIIQEDRVAYLKIDRDHFDAQALAPFAAAQSAVELRAAQG